MALTSLDDGGIQSQLKNYFANHISQQKTETREPHIKGSAQMIWVRPQTLCRLILVMDISPIS